MRRNGARGKATRYVACRAGTKAGKALSDPANRTQRALIYRAIGAGAAFEDIITAIRPALRGKKAMTVANNARWYIQDLRRRGLIRRKKK